MLFPASTTRDSDGSNAFSRGCLRDRCIYCHTRPSSRISTTNGDGTGAVSGTRPSSNLYGTFVLAGRGHHGQLAPFFLLPIKQGLLRDHGTGLGCLNL